MMYDLIILGGGPAGYLAGERAAQAGLKALVFEERSLGGVCLNEGCIPSKTLLHSAKIYDYAAHTGEKYGVHTEKAVIDYPAVVARKDKVVKTLVSGVAAALKKLGVEVRQERAVIESRNGGSFTVSAQSGAYTAKKLLIATGSEAAVPPIPGVQAGLACGFVMTNREVLSLTAVPEKLCIIGGGVIGLEMAGLFSTLGSQVTVVEMLSKIAGPTEGELSALLQKNLEKQGIRFILGAAVTEIGTDAVTYKLGEKTEAVPADKVLLSVGRRPRTQGIGLENIGVLTQRGAVVTDEQMKTNIPGVYAAGDVNGRVMLAHTAYREAEVAINSMAGKKDVMDYGAIPSVIYTNPELASIGESLESAREKGIPGVREVKTPMQYSGRYLAENEGGNGICKLVYAGERLLGVHLLGNPASEIIGAASVMLSREIPLEALKKVILPHPSVSEILREGLFSI